MIRKITLVFTCIVGIMQVFAQAPKQTPNIVFIVADDLGYGDIGQYGQKLIQTPNIDQLAREGVTFTDFHSGSPVCSPSRSVLITGLHAGHTTIRGNETVVGGKPGKSSDGTARNRISLTDQDFTVGKLMQESGYTTALIGKWHLDGYDSLATPLQRGFDEFSGWLLNYPETYADTYWPARRYRNGKLIDIKENQGDKKGYYSADLCTDEAIEFMSRHKDADKPFLLMVNYTNVHSPLEAPVPDLYQQKDWPENMKIYAAMNYHLDRSVAAIKDYLIKNGLSKNTIVFFCSDNGPMSENTAQLTEVADFFDSNGPLRGYKRDVYEGGIRVPFIVWAPGTIPAGSVCNTPGYFPDIMPTFAAIAASKVHYTTDGTSLYPLIKGESAELKTRFLYWEFLNKGFKQAVRYGKWKGVKQAGKLDLYDLEKDIGEEHDVAALHPEIVKEIETYLATCRTESPFWPVPAVSN